MLLWYLSTAVLAVWYVFRDPQFDFRLLLLGAVLPLGDAVTGGVWIMHSITFSVALVIVVMAATVGRRQLRRRWLALPIGTMLHLVFGGAWANADAFWWPLGGFGIDDASLPMVERGWGWSIVLEIAGIGLTAWIWRRARLADPGRRRTFVSSGHLAL